MPLDFTAAVRLFMGTEEELARALNIDVADLRAYRTNPGRASRVLMHRLGGVLVERGKGMARVGEMLQEDAR
jgi:hypothetical protein